MTTPMTSSSDGNTQSEEEQKKPKKKKKSKQRVPRYEMTTKVSSYIPEWHESYCTLAEHDAFIAKVDALQKSHVDFYNASWEADNPLPSSDEEEEDETMMS